MQNWIRHFSGFSVLFVCVLVGCGKESHDVEGPKVTSPQPPLPAPTPAPATPNQTPNNPVPPIQTPSSLPTAPAPAVPAVVYPQSQNQTPNNQNQTPVAPAPTVHYPMPPQSSGRAPQQPAIPSSGPRQPMTPPSSDMPLSPLTQGQPRAPQLSTAPSNLFVVISGNGGCQPRKDSRMLPGLWSTEFFDQFLVQAASPGFVTPSDDMIFICYTSFSSQMYFYDAKAFPQMVAIQEAQLDDLVIKRAGNSRKIILLGYSYGGWRAMKLASSPLVQSNVRAHILLITVDPISKATCRGAFDDGCHAPPVDFVPEELNALHNRTRWLNTFQLGGAFVSSGPIPAAHENIEVKKNHLKMPRNPCVWESMRNFLAGNL